MVNKSRLATLLGCCLVSCLMTQTTFAEEKKAQTEEASSAKGSNKEQAKFHFTNGITMLEAEDYKGAVTAFETSVSLYPTKNAYYNLANAYKALHRYGDALEAIKQLKLQFGEKLDDRWQEEVSRIELELKNLVAALFVQVSLPGATIAVDGREVGDSPMSEPVLVGPGSHEITVSKEGYATQKRSVHLVSGKKLIEHFELAAPTATLNVTSNATGAKVFLNGQEVGAIPLSKHPIIPGSHTIKIERQGYDTRTQVITAVSGQAVSIDLQLTLTAAAAPVNPTTPAKQAAPATTTTSQPEPETALQSQTLQEPPKKKRKVGTIVSFTVGGLVGAGAIATGVMQLVKTNELEEDCGGKSCTNEYKSEGDTLHTLAVTTNVLISVASVAAVAGIVLAVVEGKKNSESPSKVSISPSASPTGAGLTLSGRF